MKKLLLALLFITMGISASQAQDIKVLTYNIYHGENPGSPGKPNLHQIADLIVNLQPDVVVLQEVDSMTNRSKGIYGEKIDLVQKLAEMTGYKGHFSKAMIYSEGGYGEGILIKKGGNFQSQNLSTPAGGEPRAAIWGELTLNSVKKVQIGGTHLCHQFTENRIAQLHELIHFENPDALPRILMGDLNFGPESEEYQHIPSNWTDAAKSFDIRSNTYESTSGGDRIDYILAESKHFEVIDYQVLKVDYSDHFPVWAILRLKNP
ncbi:endonuclease/exonuclease/phosphatase family protein [Algoriphagus sp. CAU 1675]|uniref:endonuclease/exonuclease/phosphatase family protein n=1 Tax=Algoriphagus sp. CAU 1675 TaxID=3032597 RepID=UPI0023DC05F9|nr:endonuclease/exonuclease/phosphatase family protein [Algoriphagus sp. CAU 1675]MDF2158427.1 endonuclease/exonuclease/phosphatase family protein [Algoriphagus sp. CAU 1675]